AGGFGRFKVSVEDISGNFCIFPTSEFITIQALEYQDISLKINEFMADNDATNTDDAGDYDDWIEILNTGDEIFALSGLYLTDKMDNLTKWQFPFGGEVLEPGAFMVVWCDEDEDQNGYHSNFKLSAGGEFIAIVAEDGVTIIDSLSFGEQETDVSFGRFPDASDTWQTFVTPTPGSSNQLETGIQGNGLLNGFYLSQNYPNPFNPATTIEFRIPYPEFVTINVYNVLGQQITTLVSEKMRAGHYKYSWDTGDLAGGIYFYRFHAGNYIHTKKLILLE
ncbi:MAG: lamin tail domain-containing protein, partial [Candidatus Marinimicrobia bacterium]|nr:lamin tail domain-containing protein [Candidatus Neomarinimicrobiota bacterium]